jgi:CheY-like chemotaxis protein
MAAEVRQMVTVRRPDVLLSAITLLDEDGYALIRSLRTDPTAGSADIPAAALTSHVRVEDRTRALAAGFQTHIRKPVDAAELVAAVAGLASLRRRG